MTIGHLDLIEAAAEYGSVIVVVNSDEFLIEKKGFVFQPLKHRMRIMKSLARVIAVHSVNDWDGTVVNALARLEPDYFVNGGDRVTGNPKEDAICHDLGITQIFTGQPKVSSSTQLVRNVQ